VKLLSFGREETGRLGGFVERIVCGMKSLLCVHASILFGRCRALY